MVCRLYGWGNGWPMMRRPTACEGECGVLPVRIGPAACGRPSLAHLRWPRLVLPVIVAVVAFLVLIAIIAGVWTDFLWYRAIHYSSVFSTTYGTRWAMFFVAGLFMAVVTGANAVLAYRLRPIYRPVPAPGQGGDAYRLAIDPHRRLLLGLVVGVVGVISGLTAAGSWRTWLLFANQVPFRKIDPQFKWDLSFFVFTYPFIRMVLSYLFAAVLLSLVLATLVHYLYGGLRMQGRRPRVTMAAQAHLFVLFGVFVLLKAVAYWVDRYGIDFSQRGAVTTGASYTDVNAVLPAKTVLAVIAVLCALLFFAGAARRSAMLPAVGFGLLVLSAILIGGLYPAIIQQFVVKPNELAKETPYIHREIYTTRQAYGVTSPTVRVSPYSATTNVPQSTLDTEVSTLKGMRLLDPDVVSPTFQQLQQVKSYYQFPSNLAMDRYPLPGPARCRRTRSWRCAAWAAPRPARGTGSTPTWCTRTASGWSRPPPTRWRATATRPSWRATSRRTGICACGNPGCISVRGRTRTRSSAAPRAAAGRSWTTRQGRPAASRTTPTAAAAAWTWARR